MGASNSNLESFFREETTDTPQIEFKDGTLNIKGRSLPENSIEFYKPLIDYLEEYSKNPADLTKANIQLIYFNTPSSKCILDVFKKIESIYKSKHDVIINWYYEEGDEDMLEAGEDYEGIIRVPFKLNLYGADEKIDF